MRLTAIPRPVLCNTNRGYIYVVGPVSLFCFFRFFCYSCVVVVVAPRVNNTEPSTHSLLAQATCSCTRAKTLEVFLLLLSKRRAFSTRPPPKPANKLLEGHAPLVFTTTPDTRPKSTNGRAAPSLKSLPPFVAIDDGFNCGAPAEPLSLSLSLSPSQSPSPPDPHRATTPP